MRKEEDGHVTVARMDKTLESKGGDDASERCLSGAASGEMVFPSRNQSIRALLSNRRVI